MQPFSQDTLDSIYHPERHHHHHHLHGFGPFSAAGGLLGFLHLSELAGRASASPFLVLCQSLVPLQYSQSQSRCVSEGNIYVWRRFSKAGQSRTPWQTRSAPQLPSANPRGSTATAQAPARQLAATERARVRAVQGTRPSRARAS